MKYSLLIYTDESKCPKPGTPEFGKGIEAYGAFNEEAAKNGALVGGEPLEEVASASTVRVRDGKRTVTDGPFAETKEQLAGFYILDCKDLDEALDYAANIPGAHLGSVEVRPVMQMPG